jgi:hypothetical protein
LYNVVSTLEQYLFFLSAIGETRICPSRFKMPKTILFPAATHPRFLTFYFHSKWFNTFFINTQQLANNSKKLLNCFITYFSYKPQPINRNTQNKIFQKFTFVFLIYSKRITNTFKSICISTFAALKPVIFAFQCPLRATFFGHRRLIEIYSTKFFGPFSLAITYCFEYYRHRSSSIVLSSF